MQYRCPKHDVLFDALSDQRAPGALAKGNFAAHPDHCHPDCPMKESKTESASASTSTRVSNR